MPSNLTPQRVPLVDPETGIVSREWYNFFLTLFNLTGAGGNDVSLMDLQVAPPPFEMGEILKNGPLVSSFRAYRNNAYNAGVGNVTIPYDTVEWDLLGEFNASTFTFTPRATGKYIVDAGIAFNTAQPAGAAITFEVRINGGAGRYLFFNNIPAQATPSYNGSSVMALTAGDAVTMIVAGHVNPSAVYANPRATWFAATRIR